MIKIGLIGAGFMGSMHLSAYKQLLQKGNFKVTAIADLDNKKASKYADELGAKVYKDGNDLLQNADVNTVDICLPTYLHFEYAMKAVERGYNIFVEKPLCLKSADAQTLANAAKQRGVLAMVGQCIRFWDEYTFLKQLVDDKTYGEVVSAFFRRLSPRPTWGWKNWLLKPKNSGGAALDLHIHDSDFMLHIFGEPQKIKTTVNKRGEKNSYILSLCKYNDFDVVIEGTWDLPASFPFEMYYRVVFENAVVEFSSIYGLKVYDKNGVTVPSLNKKCVAGSAEGGNISDLGGYFNELSYFIDCLSNGKNPDVASLNEGAKSVGCIERELKSKL